MKRAKAKRAAKTRTSIWLDNDLRKKLDARRDKEGRSLANMIEVLLRDGLKRDPKAEPASATVFG